MIADDNAGLEDEFIANQRGRLERMLDRYRGDQGRPADEGIGLDALDTETAYGDDADEAPEQTAIESQPDFDVTADAEAEQHIESIQRALEKIEEGTYGLSDDSGEPIPRGRLESLPEARYTLAEEQQHGPEISD